jgi:hypothetical protein
MIEILSLPKYLKNIIIKNSNVYFDKNSFFGLNIKSIYLSKVQSRDKFILKKELKYFKAEKSELNSLEFSEENKLEYICLYNNKINNLNLYLNKDTLRYLNLSSVNIFKNLDLSTFKQLKTLSISDTLIDSLITNSTLSSLNVQSSNHIDISKSINLKIVKINLVEWKLINLQNPESVTELHIKNLSFNLPLYKFKNLKILCVKNYKGLVDLNLKACNNLNFVEITDTILNKIFFPPNIKYINLIYTQVTFIDVTKCNKLRDFIYISDSKSVLDSLILNTKCLDRFLIQNLILKKLTLNLKNFLSFFYFNLGISNLNIHGLNIPTILIKNLSMYLCFTKKAGYVSILSSQYPLTNFTWSNSNIRKIYIKNDTIKELDFSNCWQLSKLNLDTPNLKNLILQNVNLSKFIINANLNELTFKSNRLKYLKVSHVKKIIFLSIIEGYVIKKIVVNQIYNISISNYCLIEKLNIYNVTNIDFLKTLNCKNIMINDCKLKHLYVKSKILRLRNVEIKNIYFKKCPFLKILEVTNSKLNSLLIDSNINIEKIILNNTIFNLLDVSFYYNKLFIYIIDKRDNMEIINLILNIKTDLTIKTILTRYYIKFPNGKMVFSDEMLFFKNKSIKCYDILQKLLLENVTFKFEGCYINHLTLINSNLKRKNYLNFL